MSLSANFEAHSSQNDFVVFFRLGVEDENGQALFFFFTGIHFQNPGETSEHILVDHDSVKLRDQLGSTAGCISIMTGLVNDQLK